VEYSGSLLPYSFAESSYPKSVSLVEIDAAGRCCVERVPLTPRHAVRRIAGTLAELLRGPAPGERADDYLEAELLDQGPVLDAMGRLGVVYPNLLHISRPSLVASADGRLGSGGDHRRRDSLDLFRSFFEDVTARTLDAPEAAAFVQVMERLRGREREGQS
jgi:exonuclease SbcD